MKINSIMYAVFAIVVSVNKYQNMVVVTILEFTLTLMK